jgi:hypothetical protein
MGGYGSGWRGIAKTTVEDCLFMSAAKLTSDRMLRANWQWCGVLSWTRVSTGEKISYIEFDSIVSSESGSVHFKYTKTKTGDAVDYKTKLTSTLLPRGGRRWWFVCPLVVGDRPCRRRVDKLYLPPSSRYFGCRHCHQLTYTSCQESHKYDNCLALIGASRGMTAPEVAKLLRRDWRR